VVHLFTGVQDRLANMCSTPRWGLGWNRLDERDERRISPFLAESSPVEVDEKAGRIPISPFEARHLSEMTLVPDETRSERPDSDTSLLVHVPGSEKDLPNLEKGLPNPVKDLPNPVKDLPNPVKDLPNWEKDVTDAYSDQIEIDSCELLASSLHQCIYTSSLDPFVLSGGEERAWDQRSPSF
jgi:hypothetical protein